MKKRISAGRKSAHHKRKTLKRNAKGQFTSKRGKSRSSRARYARKANTYLSW